MKIENHQLHEAEAAAARRAQADRDAESARLRQSGGTQDADRVALSAQANQVEATVQAAREAPEVRFYLVELARQLHDEGRLGRDLDQLADRLIDSVLEL